MYKVAAWPKLAQGIRKLEEGDGNMIMDAVSDDLDQFERHKWDNNVFHRFVAGLQSVCDTDHPLGI